MDKLFYVTLVSSITAMSLYAMYVSNEPMKLCLESGMQWVDDDCVR